MRLIKMYFLIFLGLCSVLFFNIIELKADAKGCIYEGGGDRVIVNEKRIVFGFTADGKIDEKSLGTVNMLGAAPQDGNFSEPFLLCPQLYKYELGASHLDVFSVSPCKIDSALDVDNLIKKCDFLLEHIIVRPSPYGIELGEMTLKEAILKYEGRLNFKTTSIKKEYTQTWYKNLSPSDFDEEKEVEAIDEVNKTADVLASCVESKHPEAHNLCKDTNETEEYISCVKRNVSNYQCEAEEAVFRAAVANLGEIRELKQIQINLGELSCEEILGEDFIELLKKIFGWLQVIGIAFVIVLSLSDLLKAVASSKEEDFKKTYEKFTKRLVILIILIILPILIEFILGATGGFLGLTNPHPFCG